MLPQNKDQADMALASVQGHQVRVPWHGGEMRAKREGSCTVQGPRGPGPGPGGPAGAPPHRTRPAATAFAAPVARQNRPGPSRGVSYMPGVPPAPQPLLPPPQAQDRTPAACFPSTTALCAGPGIWATPDRHRLRPPPASGPGQGLAFAARKKAEGSRASGQGYSGLWASIASISASSSSGPGRPSPRHTLPDQELQVCRPSITKLPAMFPRASTSGTKTGHYLPEAQALLCPKEASFSGAHSPKVVSLVPEPRRPPGTSPPNPTLPTRPQISGSPRDTLKGWLAGGQACAPALNPGSPLWSLLSPG
ncbi:proline-rich protein 30 isoform X2 [Pongo abelii]|uniref:PRR30 isoform 2 n=1 Tax=Pongo abelii TaxID=9601 RepID=A0A2J8VMW3_PONAB|nr:proline-rich protein 30 isoform X2 [Pongo abelii]XP_054403701.1 proline-rich protein 30 isoform X2 [Pongo abelii]PNJ58861.1 PRR30 isoform 2 [Pongo abelii]